MTFEYNGLVWFQTIGLKETAVSDQSRFQANGGAVYNTPEPYHHFIVATISESSWSRLKNCL